MDWHWTFGQDAARLHQTQSQPMTTVQRKSPLPEIFEGIALHTKLQVTEPGEAWLTFPGRNPRRPGTRSRTLAYMFPSRQKVLLVYPTCFLNSFLGPCKALLRKDLSDMFYIDGLEQMLVNVRLHFRRSRSHPSTAEQVPVPHGPACCKPPLARGSASSHKWKAYAEVSRNHFPIISLSFHHTDSKILTAMHIWLSMDMF